MNKRALRIAILAAKFKTKKRPDKYERFAASYMLPLFARAFLK